MSTVEPDSSVPRMTPFGEHLGLELVEAGEGSARVRLELAEHL